MIVKIAFLMLIGIWVPNSFAADSDVKLLYKAKYIELVKPLFADKMMELLKADGKTSDEIDIFLNNYSSKLADCQIQVISIYDQKYQNVIYEVIASGGSVADSNAKVNILMQHDVSTGEVSKEHIIQLIDNAKSYMAKCSDDIIGQK